MGLFKRRQAPVEVSPHVLLENKYLSSRNNLLLVIIFTLINIVMAALGNDSYFLFSASIPYYIFKTEFIKALDILGYTLYHQLTGPDYELYSYNYEYGLTPEGYPSNQIRYVVKTLDLLIYNLGVLLKGES